jgi:hypothetical protein
MGLVDYGSSDSESEAPPAPKPSSVAKPPPNATTKKPFQRVVDRANPGKILVNLPTVAKDTQPGDEPPAKRARTGAGGGRFSRFHYNQPPPKLSLINI